MRCDGRLDDARVDELQGQEPIDDRAEIYTRQCNMPHIIWYKIPAGHRYRQALIDFFLLEGAQPSLLVGCSFWPYSNWNALL